MFKIINLNLGCIIGSIQYSHNIRNLQVLLISMKSAMIILIDGKYSNINSDG